MTDLGRRLRSRLRALLDRNGAERDLDDELRFHLDMETEYQMRMGLPESEAKRRARREFGGVERYRDESRDARGVAAIEDFFRDLRVASRSLRRAPGFALVSIFTVALGIGATTAVFSIIDGVLLRPLPYPAPNELVRVYERSPDYPTSSFSAANFADVERHTKALRAVAYYASWTETVLGLSQPVRVEMARVSERFLDVMGVPPAAGRGFLVGQSRGDDRDAVVISDRFWRSWLNARPDWQNHLLRLDGETLRIVGIMPAGFSFPTTADLWRIGVDDNPSRTTHNWSVIGRLRPGRTMDEAKAELDQLFAGMKRDLGKQMDAEGVSMRTLREALTFRVKTLCYVLLAAVGLVLLVACTNLASANLARGESQQREIAVRASLGAGRGRLVRQLATEKILLSVLGGVLGIALAWLLVRVAIALGAGTLPAFASVTIDVRVMLFGLVMALATGVVTGVLPALRVTSNLRGAATGGGAGRSRSFRGPLIAAEVALATTLVIGAGLFLRSFGQLMAEDPGYAIEQITLGDVVLPMETYSNRDGGYGDTIAIPRFYTQVLSRLRATPGVQSVALINQIPLGRNSFGTRVAVDGGSELTQDGIDYRVVDSGYFAAMGIPVLRGRVFTSADRSGTEHVVVVNRATAELLWPGQNPLGHRIRPPGMDLHKDVWLTVVGVVENVKQDGLDQPAPTQMYVHFLQRPERAQGANLVVRAAATQPVAPAIRAAVAEADRNAVVEITSMEALLDQSVATRRFSMTVVSAFSTLALFLAAVGIYGALAYAVVQRQREIGVRMAIGLSRGGVARLILGDAMKAVTPGLIVGLIGAYFSTRFVQSMLYGIAAVDSVTYLVTPAVILGVALLASLWPASRASRVDPMIAMRAE